MDNKPLGSAQIVHVVMAIDSSAWKTVDCYGAFYDFEHALDYAREQAIKGWIAEDLCVTDEDLMKEDDSQFTTCFEHDESDYKIVIDTAIPRDFTLNKTGEVR